MPHSVSTRRRNLCFYRPAQHRPADTAPPGAGGVSQEPEQGPEKVRDPGCTPTAPAVCSVLLAQSNPAFEVYRTEKRLYQVLSRGLTQHIFLVDLGQHESPLREKLRKLYAKVLMGHIVWGSPTNMHKFRGAINYYRCLLCPLFSFHFSMFFIAVTLNPLPNSMSLFQNNLNSRGINVARFWSGGINVNHDCMRSIISLNYRAWGTEIHWPQENLQRAWLRRNDALRILVKTWRTNSVFSGRKDDPFTQVEWHLLVLFYLITVLNSSELSIQWAWRRNENGPPDKGDPQLFSQHSEVGWHRTSSVCSSPQCDWRRGHMPKECLLTQPANAGRGAKLGLSAAIAGSQ